MNGERKRRSPGMVLFPIIGILLLLSIIPVIINSVQLQQVESYLYYDGSLYGHKSPDRYRTEDLPGPLEAVGTASYVKTTEPETLDQDFQCTRKIFDNVTVYRLMNREEPAFMIPFENYYYLYILIE